MPRYIDIHSKGTRKTTVWRASRAKNIAPRFLLEFLWFWEFLSVLRRGVWVYLYSFLSGLSLIPSDSSSYIQRKIIKPQEKVPKAIIYIQVRFRSVFLYDFCAHHTVWQHSLQILCPRGIQKILHGSWDPNLMPWKYWTRLLGAKWSNNIRLKSVTWHRQRF